MDSTPLVVLLYRLRHAKNDAEWLHVHEELSSRLRGMTDDDIRQHVIRFYTHTHSIEVRVVERDIAALQSDMFRPQTVNRTMACA